MLRAAGPFPLLRRLAHGGHFSSLPSWLSVTNHACFSLHVYTVAAVLARHQRYLASLSTVPRRIVSCAFKLQKHNVGPLVWILINPLIPKRGTTAAGMSGQHSV